MITLTELKYLVSLARERHFGRAAEQCSVTQPTLSIAIKKLEDRLKVALFERTAHEVGVTEIGEQLATQAEKVLSEAEVFMEVAQGGRNPLQSSLRLGVIYTAAPYLLPNLVPAIGRIAPAMSLYLQEGYTDRLLERLKLNALDAVIIALPYHEAGIAVRPLYNEVFQVLLPADHPLAKHPVIEQRALEQQQMLLLGAGNCFRDQVVAACPHLGKNGGPQFEGSSLETLRYMVASGAGLTVVPNSAAALWGLSSNPGQQSWSATVLRPFAEPEPSRTLAIAWRLSFPRPRAIEAICRAIVSNLPLGVRAAHG